MILRKNPEAKRLLIISGVLLLVFIGLALSMSLINLQITKRVINNNNAAILGLLVEKYPDAEGDIVDSMINLDFSRAEEGEAILSNYGFTSAAIARETDIYRRSSLRSSILYISITLIISITFILLYSRFLRGQYRKLQEVTEYARNIQNRDYSLDIRDNSEGDISILKNEIYKITTMLKEQAETLERDKVALSESIADISHQLKTPMTSLLMLNDLLYDRPPDEVQMEFLNRMRSQIKRIDWLVSALLKLSKLEAGTIVMKKEEVAVGKLIDSTLKELSIPLELKSQRVNIEGNNTAGFLGDFNWSREALINILKNCIEHTPEGGTIDILLEENPIYTGITIKDTGYGIDKEDLPYIFNRFYRGKNASNDSVGIGLAMSNTIIEKQGGDITVKSEKNKGSEFTIKLYKGVI